MSTSARCSCQFKTYDKPLHCVCFTACRQRLINGLAKLSEANSLVGVMQDELVSIGPKIEEKAKVGSCYTCIRR